MGQESSTTEFERSRYFRFGDFELDVAQETLTCNGERIDLKRRTFQVLLLLMERRGDVVTKQEFFEQVWTGSFVEDNNLSVAITALRKALGDNPKEPRFIENLPRRGYRFLAPVTEIGDSPDLEQSREIARTSRIGSNVWVVVGLVLALTVIGAFGFKRALNLPGPALNDPIDSVAVLPFETLSEDGGYLTDGLTEGVINNLSRHAGLRVVDKNSVYQYKGKSPEPGAVARELNVRAVVTGRVERSGDALIINAEMRDATSGAEVWHQQYRRRVSDIFAVQQEISKAIVQELRIQPSENSAKRQTVDPEAYELYLKGRYYLNKRTETDFKKSNGYFQAAIDRDPAFAKAYVGLADSYTLGAYSELKFPIEEKNAMIRSAIEKALEIDDSLSEAYAALAINKCFYEWDFPGAEADYRRAIELDPNNATAHHWYAEFLSMQGRFDESFAEYERAISIDPLSLPIKTDMALCHYYGRDYDRAISMLNRVREVRPDYVRTYEFLGWVYAEKGMFAESLEMSETAAKMKSQNGGAPTSEFEETMTRIAKIRNAVRKHPSDGFWTASLDTSGIDLEVLRAMWFAKLGDADNAFAELERALKLRNSGMVWLKVQPEFESLRSDPRFQDIMRRVGF